MDWYLYIAEFKYGLYTGISKDTTKRIEMHNKGIGAKSLIGKGPIKLVYKEQYASHKHAAKREVEIKGWTRKKKLQLISNSKII